MNKYEQKLGNKEEAGGQKTEARANTFTKCSTVGRKYYANIKQKLDLNLGKTNVNNLSEFGLNKNSNE